MAGIYVHIPFCKSRCIYCGFYSTTLLGERSRYVDCVCKELESRTDYLKGETINTIYFGGGTPSQLPSKAISRILNTIRENYSVDSNAEITMEANPDDVKPEFVEKLKGTPINRISLGVQTFDDERLKFIHRRHSASQAIDAVNLLKANGYTNISIDLIFGFPGQTLDDWKKDIERAIQLDVQHLSAYSLMYEEGTPLYHLLESGKIEEIEEELSVSMYGLLIDRLSEAGFLQYEISNFAKPNFHSRHNSSYWNNIPYLGIGAGAHSFDGKSRSWNISNLIEYCEGIEKGGNIAEEEILTETQRYNERIMTRLRTSEGLNLKDFEAEFGEQRFETLRTAVRDLMNSYPGCLEQRSEFIRLTRNGIMISNQLMSDLFIE